LPTRGSVLWKLEGIGEMIVITGALETVEGVVMIFEATARVVFVIISNSDLKFERILENR